MLRFDRGARQRRATEQAEPQWREAQGWRGQPQREADDAQAEARIH